MKTMEDKFAATAKMEFNAAFKKVTLANSYTIMVVL